MAKERSRHLLPLRLALLCDVRINPKERLVRSAKRLPSQQLAAQSAVLQERKGQDWSLVTKQMQRKRHGGGVGRVPARRHGKGETQTLRRTGDSMM